MPRFGFEERLAIPEQAAALVLLAHGSGQLGPRNQQAALTLRGRGLGTLLFDLLTPADARDRRKVFDIELLASEKRLEIIAGATHLFEEPGTLERAIELAAAWLSSHLAEGKLA